MDNSLQEAGGGGEKRQGRGVRRPLNPHLSPLSLTLCVLLHLCSQSSPPQHFPSPSFLSLPLNRPSLFLFLFYFSYFVIFLSLLPLYLVTSSKIHLRRALPVSFMEDHHPLPNPKNLLPTLTSQRTHHLSSHLTQ